MNLSTMEMELVNLKSSYRGLLQSFKDRVEESLSKASKWGQYSSHDAHNMSAACQELAVQAGKIEQTENVVRWMKESEAVDYSDVGGTR